MSRLTFLMRCAPVDKRTELNTKRRMQITCSPRSPLSDERATSSISNLSSGWQAAGPFAQCSLVCHPKGCFNDYSTASQTAGLEFLGLTRQ